MQHNIEDTKLQSLESAWQQVDETNKSKLENAIIDIFNNIPLEEIDSTSSESEREASVDDSDGDLPEIEIRTIYNVFGVLPKEKQVILSEFNDNELSLKMEELLRSGDNKLTNFINTIKSITTQNIDSIYDFEYSNKTGEFNLIVESEIDDISSSEATLSRGESDYEKREPLRSRGLSQSDFGPRI